MNATYAKNIFADKIITALMGYLSDKASFKLDMIKIYKSEWYKYKCNSDKVISKVKSQKLP